MKRFNPIDFEDRIAKMWEDKQIYATESTTTKPKKYILEFFPYPSGAAMHVGHVRNYSIGDALARFYRMNGYNVLHPMGWDAFGLPAENYAIKTGISPKQAVAENVLHFKKQLSQMGFGYDWTREINSTDPSYYKWTQWFFNLLFKKGLAYQAENMQWWCDKCKTVLANEQVVNGKCWRHEGEEDPIISKRPLRQWFFRITDYADRLISDLDDLDWSESIKSIQENWIGRSIGAEVDFRIQDSDQTIKVFTTRADTLFGATFLVISPEHPVIDSIVSADQKTTVQQYQQASAKKDEITRQLDDKDKSGVFTGAYAINPINQQPIPIWTADYVLMGYGTGAIMAVPAHDERDMAFAKKFELPINYVICPQTGTPQKNPEFRKSIVAIVRNPVTNQFLTINWGDKGGHLFVGGGVEEGEDVVETAIREIKEETGYSNLKFIAKTATPIIHNYFAHSKNVSRQIDAQGLYFELIDESRIETQLEQNEKDQFEVVWTNSSEVENLVKDSLHSLCYDLLIKNSAYSGEGVMINSGQYDGLSSAEARDKIIADLSSVGVGQQKVNYKIRDWLISRQRYWGAPIPIIWIKSDDTIRLSAEIQSAIGGNIQTKEIDGQNYQAVPVTVAGLPVELPDVESYEPDGSGKGPLARSDDWLHVWLNTKTGSTQPYSVIPENSEDYVEGWRETDTMDGFACSSWYFFRFVDSQNQSQPFDKKMVDYWGPVDIYIGGAEHAVMHLLYARMWTKIMYDEGLVECKEPFLSLKNQGMILAPDGRKMSKSYGNVIAPDDIIKQGYGADSIRVMEYFIGPWNQKVSWSTEGMAGCYRFLNRIWNLVQEYQQSKSSNKTNNQEFESLIHSTIKKVTVDIHEMGFNTAVATLMEYVNKLYKLKVADNFESTQWQNAVEVLLKLTAPIAPYVTEELWSTLGHSNSIHLSQWPIHDDNKIVLQKTNFAVQVNGKLRAVLELDFDIDEANAVKIAQQDHNVEQYLDGKDLIKTIFVKNKLISFVVK